MALLSSFAVALLTVLVLYYCVGAILGYRRLRQFPGPPLASLSRFWLFWKECRGSLPSAQVAALAKYGNASSMSDDRVDDESAMMEMKLTRPQDLRPVLAMTCL